MHYVSVENLTKSYGIMPLFKGISFNINEGDRIALVARNGIGKTTLLNILSASIPDTERIVTIEDSAELQLQQEHVVRLETRPPNLAGLPNRHWKVQLLPSGCAALAKSWSPFEKCSKQNAKNNPFNCSASGN